MFGLNEIIAEALMAFFVVLVVVVLVAVPGVMAPVVPGVVVLGFVFDPVLDEAYLENTIG